MDHVKSETNYPSMYNSNDNYQSSYNYSEAQKKI